MDNLETVVLLLKKLFAAYTHKQSTEGMIAVYLERLQSIPVDELGPVIDQCLDECKFLPTIAEIKDRHRALTGLLAHDTAAEQWGQVQKAIIEVGYVQTPNFRNPVTARVVAAMGWRELCMSENTMADRAHFLKMYQAIADRQDAIDRLTPSARQLAERKGGLKPIGDVLRLPGTGDDDVSRN